MSTLRLVDSVTGAELLSIGKYTQTILTSLDTGFPSVRSTTSVRSGGHGVFDNTRFVGERAIVAEMVLPAGPAADGAYDTLAGLMSPSRRLYAYMTQAGWSGERRALVSPRTFACPQGNLRKAQAGWSAPAGVIEDAVASQVVLSPSGSAQGGLSFPLAFPDSFATGLVPGAALVTVGGNVDASPVIDMYGPCTNPAFVVVSTGLTIAFTGLTIAAGDFIRVDLAARTVTLNGDPNQSRLNRRDFTVSSWFTLPVGQQVQVAFSPQTPGVGCQAVLTLRNRWL